MLPGLVARVWIDGALPGILALNARLVTRSRNEILLLGMREAD